MFRNKKRKEEKQSLLAGFLAFVPTIRRQIVLENQKLSLWITHVGHVVVLIHTLIYGIKFCISLYYVDYHFLPITMPYFIIWLLFPIVLFLYSTKFDLYNFYVIKSTCLFLYLAQVWMICLAKGYQILSRLILPNLMKLQTDEVFTKGMVVMLGRFFTQLPLILLGYFLFQGIFYIYRNETSRKAILAFKITHYTHREKGSITYPLQIVKTMQSGKRISISEEDRYLHTLVDGTTGTGKTSSTILPAIKNDLNMRCKAEDMQKQKIEELLTDGKIKILNPKADFFIDNFLPTENQNLQEIQDSLDHLAKECPVCGITVLAPDDSLTDDVCRLCDGRDIVYHRIDPIKDKNGKSKKNCIGMNPFYLDPSMWENIQNQQVIKKATIFSDVLQVITDLKGKADSYFTGLNRQLIANLSILLMVTVPLLKKQQATPEYLQRLVNDFDEIPPYLEQLREMNRKNRQYDFIITYVEKDLLGSGRVKMEDQSRGTRNILNEFLLFPENREIFCAQKSIDFAHILEYGEITICNFNLASGDTNAIAYGLLFLLSYNNAVLSRPSQGKVKVPNFFYLDELPVLIHPSLEKNFSLFRKFRVAMFVAIQTLDQMEKNELTKYLKGVLLGCAHIIVFGRSSLSDMQSFSTLAGIHDQVEEQHATSETSMSSAEPSFTYSDRTTITQQNWLEEIDVRMKDFQEVTFFTTRNGCPRQIIHGKVNFLEKTDWVIKQRPTFSFDQVFCKTEIETPELFKEKKENTLDTELVSQLTIEKASEEKLPIVSEPSDGSQSIDGLL